MNYRETTEKLAAWRQQIAELRQRMRDAQASVEPVPVGEYEFASVEGSQRLSQLFGTKRDLFVIHNMGRSCPHCTLWADGFNGIHPHIADRATFVVSSPDPPDVQRSFAAGRGWRFPMVSHQGSSFAADMGYRSAAGCRACRCSAATATASCASPIPGSSPATTSAHCGTCSTCCPKEPPDGRRNSAILERVSMMRQTRWTTATARPPSAAGSRTGSPRWRRRTR
jgi:Bacterial protein of unknown function (DUF899)